MVIVGSARHDENGEYAWGRDGDQTGTEVETQEWYLHKKGWRVLRAKNTIVREKIADCMQWACDNPCIGYDQEENYKLWDVAKEVGFDCRLVATNCETDCARLVRVCVAYAGIIAHDFYTANMAYYLLETGEFDEIPAAATNPDVLLRGDILVTKTQGHTVVVVKQSNQPEVDDFDGVYVKTEGEIKMAVTYKLSTVRAGDSGPHVLLVQEILRARGFLGSNGQPLKLDGKAGENTMYAIAAYISDRKRNGRDLGDPNAWGPLCWADQALPVA